MIQCVDLLIYKQKSDQQRCWWKVKMIYTNKPYHNSQGICRRSGGLKRSGCFGLFCVVIGCRIRKFFQNRTKY